MKPTNHWPSGLSPVSDMSSAGQAPRACDKCRVSKRRCDKSLPQCARCVRLNSKCHYSADPTSPETASNSPLALFQQRAFSALLRGPDPLESVTAQQILALIPADAQPGEKLDWGDGVRGYLAYVHTWYAVVHQSLFEKKLAALDSPAESQGAQVYSPPLTDTPSDHNAATQRSPSTSASAGENMSKDLALLVVAMYLSARTPATSVGVRPMFDDFYRLIKRVLAIALLEESVPSIELIQATALLALYEYGHGDSMASYRTLSEAAAAARVLSIQPGQWNEVTKGISEYSPQEEESSGLWWALFIMDQILHRDQVTNHLPLIFEAPHNNTLLPGSVATPLPQKQHAGGFDVKYLCESELPTRQRLAITEPIDPRWMEPFQLSAKCATFLHRALRFEHQARMRQPGLLPQVAQFADLDEEIRYTTKTLLADDVNWQSTLDCFAMCISALFTLYLPFLEVLESSSPKEILASQELSTAFAALKFAAQLSTDITCKMNADIRAEGASMGDCYRYLAAPAAPTCYLVVVWYKSLGIIYPEEAGHCHEGIIDKFDSLKFFSKRWALAEKMMVQLKKCLGMDRNDYLTPVSLSPPSAQSGGQAMDLSKG